MPVSRAHNVANACDVVGWNVLVKEVAHRIDENLPWASPMQRLIELFRNESEIEALLERVSRYIAETLREQLRIAEFATRTHLRTAPHRVPSRVRGAAKELLTRLSGIVSGGVAQATYSVQPAAMGWSTNLHFRLRFASI